MSTNGVRVRMYNVGFGDCFLLRFPARDRDRTVLIDCGVHSASRAGSPLEEVVGDIIETVSTGSTPRLDVVIATHRHRDHVHGFRDQRWLDVEVGEVWLPWTEDPADPTATRIRDRQSKRANLLLSLCAADSSGQWAAVQALAENSDSYRNARAMAMLHAGFGGNPRRFFLPEPAGHERERTFTTQALPEVTIEILGPFRDEAAIRDMDPPGGEAYLRLGADDELASAGRPLPFERFFFSQSEFQAEYPHLKLKGGDLGAIVNAGRDNALGLAVSLEKAVNGTSLMLLFRYGDAAFLFTGDAQWGTWDRVLADPDKQRQLADVSVFKVGHHGSHNATPRRFVERVLPVGGLALVPVGPTGIPSWSQIPRKPLLEALTEHGLFVLRSDKWQEAGTGGPAPRLANGSTVGLEVGPAGLWTELTLAGEAEA